jgi:type I restriction-modification system DNA methylase subunit
MILLCDTKEDSIWKHIFRRISATDLPSHLEELLLLSKGGFEASLIEKEAQDEGRTKRTVSIDDELLTDIISWRQKLLASIRKHTKQEYSRAELEEIAQILLDRIIFIRTVEDRRREARPDETIKAILNQYDADKSIDVKNQMNRLFRHYDEIYDSKLFTYDENDTEKRHECERVEIDNLTYVRVLRETYDKDEVYSYNFADIDADILGAMYEKYIGTMQKRKEQGIFYTPSFVVEHIVQNTLGRVLRKTKYDNLASIRVLDMACGSGSFLLKSFDVLDQHYRLRDKDYAQTKLDAETNGAKMTRKSMILRNNIYGVDLDPKAVEIAQLNLLLKAAETRYRLPDLRDNIKCGNSLISQSLDEGLRPFEWNREFSGIMNEGGFDVVIGNPPYVRQEELLKIKPNLKINYEVYQSTADLSVYFFERAIRMLKNGGYFGMIVSNKWLKAGYGKNLRRYLARYHIVSFIDFGDLGVFKDATAYPCILVVKKVQKPNPKIPVCLVKDLGFDRLDEYIARNSFLMNQADLSEDGWNFVDKASRTLLERLKKENPSLGDYIHNESYFGIKTGLTKAFVIDEKTRDQLVSEDSRSAEILKPFLMGKEVRRYGVDFRGKYIILTRIGVKIEDYPAVRRWLDKFKPALQRRSDQGNHWYELRACDYYDLFEKPKLIYGSMTVSPRFAIDKNGYFANNANFIIPTEDRQLLAVLNSKLGWFLVSNTCTRIKGGYQLMWRYFRNVPVPRTRSSELEKESERMIRLTERLLALGKKQTEERMKLEKEAQETSKRVDELVYDLYGLTAEDRGTVEDIMRET